MAAQVKPGIVKPYLAHEERTASQPRQRNIHDVYIDEITPVNKSIRLIRLVSCHNSPIQFRAGQWLDVFIPGLSKAGGFTITSTPHEADSHRPEMELAIQYSPKNPPAAWLWKHPDEILKRELKVRVGGSFTWPPENINIQNINHLVLIAAGVGVNPLMSIITYFLHPRSPHQQWDHIKVSLVYATKHASATSPEQILFLKDILQYAQAFRDRLHCQIHLTGSEKSVIESEFAQIEQRRPTADDYTHILGEASKRSGALCYVCGPQNMTDETVALLQRMDGVRPDQVLCEKWW